MDIPLPGNDKPDIYNYGFSPGLNRTTPNITTPTVYDALNDPTNTGAITTGGNIQLKSITLEGFERTVAPGDDLQAAINALNTSGGGKLRMASGTYTVRNALTGYSNISFEGISSANTIVTFVGSANLSFAGTKIYTTGTVSAASGVSITGNGTSWLANAAAGQQIFIGTRWYKIAAVTSDTTLILSEAYGDNLSFPQNYRLGSPITNVGLKNITFQSSTGTGISMTDCRHFEFNDVLSILNNVGVSFTNCSEIKITILGLFSNTSDGCQLTNVGFFVPSQMSSIGNGGNGVTISNLKSCVLSGCASNSNTLCGISATSAIDCEFNYECRSNTTKGIEFVATCTNNFIVGSLIRNNTSDGIKFTASATNNTIGPDINIVSNGGFGINIVDSTSTNNTVIAPFYSANTSGSISDNGSATSQIGGATGVQRFSSSGAWVCPSGVSIAYITASGGGGGGGGVAAAANANSAGGGAGGAVIRYKVAVTAGTSYTVTVGTGGPGGVAGNNNGTAGGNTTFGASLVACTGGGGGTGAAATGVHAGGTAGTPNGMAASSTSNGGPGTAGASTILGNGGNNTQDATGSTAGGTGGGGGGVFTSANAFAGGAGTDGVVIVEW